MGNVGNRIRLTIERPSAAMIARFQEADPPDLCDAMNKSGAMREIAPIYRPMRRCVGPAITVKAPTGDSLMIRKAMGLAQPGDVIVIDGRGTISRSLWGGNRSTFVAQKGVAGVIIDGGTRDIAETQALNLPLFARAICPMASASSGPGEVNFPVSCGGVVVHPGDIIVATEEGIAVIPRADIESVYEAWRKIVEREKVWSAGAASGKQAGADEVDRLLAQSGCEILP
ncbi:MAG TPA: RraA family protein [bacterium]|nr:RraA family protein [bacterium]